MNQLNKLVGITKNDLIAHCQCIGTSYLTTFWYETEECMMPTQYYVEQLYYNGTPEEGLKCAGTVTLTAEQLSELGVDVCVSLHDFEDSDDFFDYLEEHNKEA